MSDESKGKIGSSVSIGAASVVTPGSTVIYTLADKLDDAEWSKLIGEVFPSMSRDQLPQQIEKFKKTAIRLKPYQPLDVVETACFLVCKGLLRVHVTQDDFLEYERKEMLVISPTLAGVWMGGAHGVVLIEIQSAKVRESLFQKQPDSTVSLPRLGEYLNLLRTAGAGNSGGGEADELRAKIEALEEMVRKKDEKIKYLLENIKKMTKFFNQVVGQVEM